MPVLHLQLTFLALAGLAVAVVIEILRSRREEKHWQSLRQRRADQAAPVS
ncbi:MAG: hypothetical protein PVG03_16630 [Desulfarculaceae bacterium]|jgi:hypothetical protein